MKTQFLTVTAYSIWNRVHTVIMIIMYNNNNNIIYNDNNSLNITVVKNFHPEVLYSKYKVTSA